MLSKTTLISDTPHLQNLNSKVIAASSFFCSMINGPESSTETLDIFSDTIELRHGQEWNVNSQVDEFSAGEVTYQSVNEQIKLATESISRQVESLCALLADWTDLNTAGNSEATVPRIEDTSTNSEDNRCETRIYDNLDCRSTFWIFSYHWLPFMDNIWRLSF